MLNSDRQTPTSKGNSESGASRARTGDLLGAIQRLGCVSGIDGCRIARVHEHFVAGPVGGRVLARDLMYPFGTRGASGVGVQQVLDLIV